jgi:hypothetical protein
MYRAILCTLMCDVPKCRLHLRTFTFQSVLKVIIYRSYHHYEQSDDLGMEVMI